jgi:hypothetical protein
MNCQDFGDPYGDSPHIVEETKAKFSKDRSGVKHPEAIFSYKLKNPNGEVFTTRVLKIFCKENNLSQGDMAACFNFKDKTHGKGWTPISRTNLNTGITCI